MATSTEIPLAASPFAAAVVSAAQDELRMAARVDARVLIMAEGLDLRETCARFIHRGSSRSQRPFVTHRTRAVEAAAHNTIPRRLFERARGGTLFIDDIAQLGECGQAELLSWLDEHVVTGSSSVDRRRSSVRIIAGANGQLDHQRRSGRFSESLFYRLNLIRIDLLR